MNKTANADKTAYAVDVADTLNSALRENAVQLCFYSSRKIIKKGASFVARDGLLYLNGRGAAYIPGTFRAYPYA